MRAARLRAEHVEFIPEELEPGVLYVSQRYRTASHLCCCGCGREVVTPLSPAKWRLIEDDGEVSLSPSIGNWSFPCRSHYWISQGEIRWAGAMSSDQISRVQARDRADAIAASQTAPVQPATGPTLWLSLSRRIRSALAAMRRWIER